MRVLVIGGTGRLGAPVVNHLARAGHEVILLTRTGGLPQGAPDAVRATPGDALDRAAVEAALASTDAVHISVSGPAEGPAVANAVAGAGRQGTSLVSYVSGSATFPEHARYPEIKTKLAAERAIIDSGLRWIILCPSFAMEILPTHVQRGLALYFGRQPHPMHWLAADDLGRAVATAYGTEEAREQRLFIRGPQALTVAEALRRYCAALHPKISKPRSLPYWLAHAIATATRDKNLATAVAVYRMYEGAGGDGGDPSNAERLLGAPESTLDAWLAHRTR
jgi:uncharacterized protein YbjT (DUF2867 family)